MTTQPVITITDLHKSYGSVVAVDGISLQVERGEVLAFKRGARVRS